MEPHRTPSSPHSGTRAGLSARKTSKGIASKSETQSTKSPSAGSQQIVNTVAEALCDNFGRIGLMALALEAPIKVTDKVARLVIESPGGITYYLDIDTSHSNWQASLEQSLVDISDYCCG